MVTIIKIGSSINRIINYNESKVTIGQAQCIGAGNYPVDLDRLNDRIKKRRFTQITVLNQSIKRNAIHISLNFSPLEDHSRETLMAIANTYMQRIGFAKQPYLVYEHYDAGHQHLHVVTTYIQKDGKRMHIYNLAYRKSEPAREEIEELFGLIKARGQKANNQLDLNPIAIKRIKYGETESKKAINLVLNYVLNQYSYTNFTELNAILSQYNLIAQRGSENSKTFLAGGLVYQILNQKAKPVGKPIKASILDNKPTLVFLENQFKENKIKNTEQQIGIKKIVNRYSIQSIALDELSPILQRSAITTVAKKDADGLIDELTFIDHKTKSFLNGDFLLKQLNENLEQRSQKAEVCFENRKAKRGKTIRQSF
ncbi:relaxase/mobilization nuclease domain-containing protein [Flavobacterium sp. CSZ]|uniref:relaxase/mobilization nuclease domain-containing protein n=1 Tax=Flavobacterium sp. CSZ TaxID=2783791 RepID=UPI00188AA6CD|nr:relaxase/mobilization nuclease domain-containing protein [Flavobacterium sp. CSZ]MBF4488209.1 relaxase/mobilization nuclease domain-containing protein [Flavobacterium sp. CSZ]